MAADDQYPKGYKARHRCKEAIREYNQYFVVPNGHELPWEKRDAENDVADAGDLGEQPTFKTNGVRPAKLARRGELGWFRSLLSGSRTAQPVIPLIKKSPVSAHDRIKMFLETSFGLFVCVNPTHRLRINGRAMGRFVP